MPMRIVILGIEIKLGHPIPGDMGHWEFYYLHQKAI